MSRHAPTVDVFFAVHDSRTLSAFHDSRLTSHSLVCDSLFLSLACHSGLTGIFFDAVPSATSAVNILFWAFDHSQFTIPGLFIFPFTFPPSSFNLFAEGCHGHNPPIY